MGFEQPEMGISEQSEDEKVFSPEDFQRATGKAVENATKIDRKRLNKIQGLERAIKWAEANVGKLAGEFSQTEEGTEFGKVSEAALREVEEGLKNLKREKEELVSKLGESPDMKERGEAFRASLEKFLPGASPFDSSFRGE